MVLFDFFLSRNLVEIVSEGRKHLDAKEGVLAQIWARQGLIDYLDQDDASAADFRWGYPRLILKASNENSKRHLTIQDTDGAQQPTSGVDQINDMLGFLWADIELPDVDLKQIDISGLKFQKLCTKNAQSSGFSTTVSLVRVGVSMVIGGRGLHPNIASSNNRWHADY